MLWTKPPRLKQRIPDPCQLPSPTTTLSAQSSYHPQHQPGALLLDSLVTLVRFKKAPVDRISGLSLDLGHAIGSRRRITDRLRLKEWDCGPASVEDDLLRMSSDLEDLTLKTRR